LKLKSDLHALSHAHFVSTGSFRPSLSDHCGSLLNRLRNQKVGIRVCCNIVSWNIVSQKNDFLYAELFKPLIVIEVFLNAIFPHENPKPGIYNPKFYDMEK
jgi:hypothetical protein